MWAKNNQNIDRWLDSPKRNLWILILQITCSKLIRNVDLITYYELILF